MLVASLAQADPLPTVSAAPIAALLPLELKRVRLDADVIEALHETLETKLIESRAFRVLPNRRLREALASKKCRDLSCRRAAGRSAGAAEVITTRITRLGGACRLSLRVYDVASGPASRAVQTPGRCSEAGLVKVIVEAVAKLARLPRPLPPASRALSAVARRGKQTCKARVKPPVARRFGSRLFDNLLGFVVVEDGAADDPEPPAGWPPRPPIPSPRPYFGRAGSLGNRAVQAYLGNNWARALKLGLASLEAHPNDQKVLSIVGASACKLRRPLLACKTYLRLQPARRGMLRQVCQHARITLTIDNKR